MLIRIYYLIIYVIEGIIFSQYCTSVFNAPKSKLLKNIAITVLYSILFFISFWQNPQINLSAFFAANFLFIWGIYRPKWYTALFHSALSAAVMCLCELGMIAAIPYKITYSYANWSEFRIWILPVICDKVVYFLCIFWDIFQAYIRGKTIRKTGLLFYLPQYRRSLCSLCLPFYICAQILYFLPGLNVWF